MQLTGILQMRSQEKIREFLNAEHVGRISTIDSDGFPQTIPMNFVYLEWRRLHALPREGGEAG